MANGSNSSSQQHQGELRIAVLGCAVSSVCPISSPHRHLEFEPTEQFLVQCCERPGGAGAGERGEGPSSMLGQMQPWTVNEDLQRPPLPTFGSTCSTCQPTDDGRDAKMLRQTGKKKNEMQLQRPGRRGLVCPVPVCRLSLPRRLSDSVPECWSQTIRTCLTALSDDR